MSTVHTRFGKSLVPLPSELAGQNPRISPLCKSRHLDGFCISGGGAGTPPITHQMFQIQYPVLDGLAKKRGRHRRGPCTPPAAWNVKTAETAVFTDKHGISSQPATPRQKRHCRIWAGPTEWPKAFRRVSSAAEGQGIASSGGMKLSRRAASVKSRQIAANIQYLISNILALFSCQPPPDAPPNSLDKSPFLCYSAASLRWLRR